MDTYRIGYSETESNRFGLRVFRGQYERFETADIEHVLEDGNYDVIIVRFPTSSIYEHYKLLKFDECKIIHADSLLYYSAPLHEIEINPLRNNLEFEVITPETNHQLDSVIKNVFKGYKNHYYANPCLDKAAIVEGYVEWVMSFVKNNENGITWLVKDKTTQANVAFQACYFDVNKSLSDLKLGGVLPAYEHKGVYADILSYSQAYFKQMGLNSLITSTQLQNTGVRRVWERYGFKFVNSYETYHIVKNSLWNATRI